MKIWLCIGINRTVCDPPGLIQQYSLLLATQTTLMKLMSVCRAICAGSNWIHKVFAMVINWMFLALHMYHYSCTRPL